MVLYATHRGRETGDSQDAVRSIVDEVYYVRLYCFHRQKQYRFLIPRIRRDLTLVTVKVYAVVWILRKQRVHHDKTYVIMCGRVLTRDRKITRATIELVS